MRSRRLLSMVLAIAAAVVLSGCNDPDRLFREGKYAEAYSGFVKRAGANEVRLREERAGMSLAFRNKAGNRSIRDFFRAAESLERMGQDDKARLFYQRVVELSTYRIRVPDDDRNVAFEVTPLKVSPANLPFVHQAKVAVGIGGGVSLPFVRYPSSAGAPTGVSDTPPEDIIRAEQAMREAYRKYLSLMTSGAPIEQILQAINEYNEARAQFIDLVR